MEISLRKSVSPTGLSLVIRLTATALPFVEEASVDFGIARQSTYVVEWNRM
jgi:hypothetical protein